jgi:hypothetical protein
MYYDKTGMEKRQAHYASGLLFRYEKFKNSQPLNVAASAAFGIIPGFILGAGWSKATLVALGIVGIVAGYALWDPLRSSNEYSLDIPDMNYKPVNKILAKNKRSPIKLGRMSNTHPRRMAKLAATMLLAASLSGGMTYKLCCLVNSSRPATHDSAVPELWEMPRSNIL